MAADRRLCMKGYHELGDQLVIPHDGATHAIGSANIMSVPGHGCCTSGVSGPPSGVDVTTASSAGEPSFNARLCLNIRRKHLPRYKSCIVLVQKAASCP